MMLGKLGPSYSCYKLALKAKERQTVALCKRAKRRVTGRHQLNKSKQRD